jgi:hypothetical protein
MPELTLTKITSETFVSLWVPAPEEYSHYNSLLLALQEFSSTSSVSVSILNDGAGAGALPQGNPLTVTSSFRSSDIERFLVEKLGLSEESARDCVNLVASCTDQSATHQMLSSDNATRALRAAALCHAGIVPSAGTFTKYLFCVMPREPSVHVIHRAMPSYLTSNSPPAPPSRTSDRALVLTAEVPRFVRKFSTLCDSRGNLTLTTAFEEVCETYFASSMDETQLNVVYLCLSEAFAGHGVPKSLNAAEFAFLCNTVQFMALGLDASDESNRLLLVRALRRILRMTQDDLSPSPKEAKTPKELTNPNPHVSLAPNEDGSLATILTESTSGMSEKAAIHYRRIFDECSYDCNGSCVSQESFSNFFIGNLGLPIGPIRYCFHLSDLDGDKFLDLAEYTIAHHLILEWLKGHTMPLVVPSQIVPLSKQTIAIQRELPLRRVTRVFISYRWETPNAKGWSVLVRNALLHLGYEFVFLDIDMLSGSAGSTVASVIKTCHALVPLWTKGCYDRCIGPSGTSDAVRIEVETALENKLVVVPIIDAGIDGFFSSGYSKSLPESMKPVLGYIGSIYVHEYPEVWIRKLHRLLQGW